jgi:hypothetical protein
MIPRRLNFMPTHKIQTPGNHPQARIQQNCVYFRRGMYPDLYKAHSKFNVLKMADPTTEKKSRNLTQLRSDEARKSDCQTEQK